MTTFTDKTPYHSTVTDDMVFGADSSGSGSVSAGIEAETIKSYVNAESVPENSVIVAKSGGNYDTIKEALQNAVARDCIVVYPGIYQEDNPLPAVDNVTIKTCGEQNTTRIEATNTNQNLFTNANFFIVQGFSLSGVSGTGWIMDITSDYSVVFRDCVFFENEQEIRLNNASAILTLDNIIYLNVSTTTTISVRNLAGNLTIAGGRVGEGSTITTLFDFDGSNAVSTIQNMLSFEAGVDTAVNVDNSARTVISGSFFVGMNDGLVAQGGSNTEVFSGAFFNAQQDNVRIDTGGSGTQIGGSGVSILGATRYDLNILSGSGLVKGFATLSAEKLNFATGATVIGAAISTLEDDEGLDIYGELHVGTPERGSESVFGGGDSYTRGMMVYTYNPSGTVWTDVSDDAKSASTSTFTFPAVAQDNAIYVASSLSDGTDFLKHFGIKSNCATAVVLGAGEIIAEYWNGSSWVEFNHMSTQSLSPYDQYAKQIFERAQSEHVRYDQNIDSAWSKNDPMTLGEDYYWVRFRIATAITTAPVFEQYKLHTNRMEINADGVSEYFGASRYPRGLSISLAETYALDGATPTNQDVDFATDLTLTLLRNRFNNNALDGFGSVISLGEGIDTSQPLKVIIAWYPNVDSGGDVELEVSLGDDTDIYDGTAAVVNTPVVTTIAAGSELDRQVTQIDLDISDRLVGDTLSFAVFRDATNGNPDDTLVGPIVVTAFRMSASFWRP